MILPPTLPSTVSSNSPSGTSPAVNEDVNPIDALFGPFVRDRLASNERLYKIGGVYAFSYVKDGQLLSTWREYQFGSNLIV